MPTSVHMCVVSFVIVKAVVVIVVCMVDSVALALIEPPCLNVRFIDGVKQYCACTLSHPNHRC